MHDFDQSVVRRGSDSYKWDGTARVFGADGLLPFWVADMDFATPQPVLDAIRERAAHPVLGYEERGDEYRDTVRDWLRKRHAWDVPADWLMFCPPSSIVGMYGLIGSLTEPDAGIVAPTPTYGPLLGLIENNGRRLIRNPLREINGRYLLDVDHMRDHLDDGTRMILLCNPHNPLGRVFTQDELGDLIALARERDLIVVADEVHSDLVLPGFRHIPMAALGYDKAVSVVSPNKAFNTAGLPQATFVIPDGRMRSAFQRFLTTTQLNHDSTFGAVAMLAAYRHCASWLDELVAYIAGNHRRTADFFTERVPGVRVIPAEATYLAWIDYRTLGLDEADMMRRLTGIGGVALYAGTEFGREGNGYVRMNIACPRTQLDAGLEGIARALA